MSGRGDDNVEMPVPPLDADAVESLLSGLTGAGDLGPMAAFVEDLRLAVDVPVPVPTADLATLLADGIPTPAGVAWVEEANPARPRAADPRKRRKHVTVSELLAALALKLTGLGMAAKAALGLGVAAASVTGAGAAGILPDPAQHAVATVVSAATPFELADSGTVGTDRVSTDDTGGVPDDTGGSSDADRADNHGACVSEVARNAPRGPGGQHGKVVSEAARSDCGKDSSAPTTTSPTSSTSTSSTTSTTLDEDPASLDDKRGRGGPRSGGGHNGSSGNGNGGNGSSGNGNSGPGEGEGPGRSGRSG